MTQAIELPTLESDVRTLPAEGAARDRQLYRLVDQRGADEAFAALAAAAARRREGSPVLNTALAFAAAVLGDQALSDKDAASDRLRDTVASPQFLSLVPAMIAELRQIASSHPATGACTVATALKLWSWTMNHLRAGGGALGASPQVVNELVDALPPLLAARCLSTELTGQTAATSADLQLRLDLCHSYAARASALAGATCAELVFGSRRHLVWDEEGCTSCYASDELDDLEALMPGIASGARTSIDIVEADGSHPAKAGPCASLAGLDAFVRLRTRLDGCLTGARIAKDRAAATLERSSSTAERSA
jgi:hypothetical protein